MTDDQIQERILVFLDTRGGYVASASERELFLMVKAAVATERARCARIAGHVLVNDPYALHPDIAFDDLNESARMAAHSMAQTISMLIQNGVERASDLPD